ncbi:MAG TPA: flagellar motor protein MotB [Solirubrobacteraceae bacterium]|jgi:chemotaxis protein MotB|nr:flagellar motor protein MotB [Solirubrobacteraceae bacterium]
MAPRHSKTRRSSHHGGDDHAGGAGMERWLLTYADMLTLLFALFIVLYAISSLNTGKFDQLRVSLQEAFSGKVLPGGKSVLERGASEEDAKAQPQVLVPVATAQAAEQLARRIHQQDVDFARLKKMIDAEAARDGLSSRLQTRIERRGLVVRLLTDKIAFDSGSARLKPQVQPLLTSVARIIFSNTKDAVVVEGYTDSVPLRRHASYPTNWELSSARASAVVRHFIRKGMPPGQLSTHGYAYLHPLASNSTADGRSRNRRVEIVIVRPGMEGSK